jgi:hypothetical protein
MKQGTAIIAFKKFEMSHPAKVLGGQVPPIIDKKKIRTPNRGR